MNDNPLDSIPAFNRLPIRAVITRPGEDPSAALAAAGIVNPISIPIAITGSMDEAAALLGTGTMPHLAAVLEFIDRIDDGLNKTDPLGGYPRSPAANVSTVNGFDSASVDDSEYIVSRAVMIKPLGGVHNFRTR